MQQSPEFSADPVYQKKMDIFAVKRNKADEKRVENVIMICLLARRNPCEQIDIVLVTTTQSLNQSNHVHSNALQ